MNRLIGEHCHIIQLAHSTYSNIIKVIASLLRTSPSIACIEVVTRPGSFVCLPVIILTTQYACLSGMGKNTSWITVGLGNVVSFLGMNTFINHPGDSGIDCELLLEKGIISKDELIAKIKSLG